MRLIYQKSIQSNNSNILDTGVIQQFLDASTLRTSLLFGATEAPPPMASPEISLRVFWAKCWPEKHAHPIIPFVQELTKFKQNHWANGKIQQKAKVAGPPEDTWRSQSRDQNQIARDISKREMENVDSTSLRSGENSHLRRGKDETTTRWGSTLWSDVVKNVQNVGKCSLIFNLLHAWDVSWRRLPVRSKHWTWWWNPIRAQSCGVEKQKSQKSPSIVGWETPRIQQGGAAERYQKSQEAATSRISTDSLLLKTRKKWNVIVRNYTLLVVKRHNQGAPKGKRNTIHGTRTHLQLEMVLHLVSSAISKQNVNTHFGQARFLRVFPPLKMTCWTAKVIFCRWWAVMPLVGTFPKQVTVKECRFRW